MRTIKKTKASILTKDEFTKDITPIVIDYNQTKKEEISNLTIKGRPMVIASMPPSHGGRDKTGIYKNENSTLFIRVNSQKNFIGNTKYKDNKTGEEYPVDLYGVVNDYIILYYPEKTIVGWHRAAGSTPSIPNIIYSEEEFEDYFKNSNGTYSAISSDDLTDWIMGLPGYDNKYFSDIIG